VPVVRQRRRGALDQRAGRPGPDETGRGAAGIRRRIAAGVRGRAPGRATAGASGSATLRATAGVCGRAALRTLPGSRPGWTRGYDNNSISDGIADGIGDATAGAALGAAKKLIGRAVSRRAQRTVNEVVLPAMVDQQQTMLQEQIAIAEQYPELRACLTDRVIFLVGGSRVMPLPAIGPTLTLQQADALVAQLREG
jgi:hypothetical protein